MRSYIIAILILFQSYCTFAQQLAEKDSLLKLLPSAKEDTNKVKNLIRIGQLEGPHDVKSYKEYSRRALALSQKINYPFGIFVSYVNIGEALKTEGNFDSSLIVNLLSADYARKINNQRYLGFSLYNIGISYIKLGQYENATASIEESRAIFQRLGEEQFQGDLYNIMQNLANEMHQYRKGIDFGLKAIPLLEKSDGKDAKESLCNTLNNLGLNYIMVQSYDSAIIYLKKAYELALQHDFEQVKSTYNINMALIAMRRQNLDSLKYYTQNVLDLTRSNGMNEFKSLALYGLSSYHLSKKDYGKSRLYSDSALHIAEKYNLRKLRQRLYPLLSNYYFAIQDTKKGNYYTLQTELLEDSILNESIMRNTVDIEKKYETQRKDDQIRLQQSQLKQQSIVTYFLIAGAIGLSVILILSYRNYKSRQRLQQTKIDELEKERQLNATEAVLKGEEQERARLAKELHDGLGGMLSGIKYSFINMKENLVMLPENVQTFERNLDMLDTSIREMRRVAHNLMPEILLKYGLNAALKEFCNEISRSGVLSVAYQPMGLEKATIDQTTSLAVYRIVQELVNNVIKHATAKTVLVQVHASEQDKLLSVTVEDDGKGFAPDALGSKSGIGWINIQNRIDFLKGRADISSAPGGGTSVLVEIDL